MGRKQMSRECREQVQVDLRQPLFPFISKWMLTWRARTSFRGLSKWSEGGTAVRRELRWRDIVAYISVPLVLGASAAHLMFDLPIL